MLSRSSIGSLALAAALSLVMGAAHGFDDTSYPDWRGQWSRMGGGNWDPDKARGLAQQAPLTAEYQAVLDESLADQARGGQGNDPGYRCRPHGMPRAMIGIQPIQFVILPETTYVMHELFSQLRRIYTDGRSWPAHVEPSSLGYSIGRWLDEDGDGRYDTLLVETRGLKNPRSYDSSGIPFHKDNQTVVKERIRLDTANPSVLQNEVTTIDNALTRPWTVTRSYRQKLSSVWIEYICSEDNHHVVIGDQNYLVNAEGYLMPVRKGQPPPDLKYFDPPPK
ncbi:MAG: hypothetical protein QOG83_1012 [Alphaproteobacteria bacterium]|jgi:hypothetical protein|nr:hypothetical protein [Alphaproteobacteria bacterium]